MIRTARLAVAALAVFFTLGFITPAFAQDAGHPADMAQAAPAASAPAASAVLDPAKDPSFEDGAQIIQKAIGAGTSRDWRALGAAIILLVVFIMRKIVGNYVAFFKTDKGGAVMALVIGVLGTVAGLVSASGKFQWSMVVDGFLAAFTAAGGYATLKKLMNPAEAAPAPAVVK